MNSSLDLNLLPITRQGGNDKAELPDMYAVTPPRRTARGREADSLIIYLSMTGNSPLSAEAHAQLLEQLAHKFYKTTGSLTAALRTIAEALNLYLLDRNLRSTNVGRQGIGQLILVALRVDTLYITQCGVVHAFFVTQKETQHLHDPQSSGRGLGLSRTTPMRFLQVKMEPDDYLVLATQASPGWAVTSLRHPQQQGIEALRRQLLENSSQDFNSVIVQALAGTGKLRMLKRKATTPVMAHPTTATPPVEAAPPTTLVPAANTVGLPTEDKRLGVPSIGAALAETYIQPAEDRKLGIPSISSTPAETSSQPAEDKKLGVPSISATPAEISSQSAEDRKLGIPSSPPAPAVYAAEEDQTSAVGQPETVPFSGQNFSQPPGTYQAGAYQPGISRGEAARPAESTFSPAPQPARTEKTHRTSHPAPWAKYFASFRQTLTAIGATILRALRSTLATLARALLRLLKSLLPDADVLRLPPSMMIFIALAIPLVLATIGGMVYLQRGRAQQHEIFYQQAVDEAAYADTITNPLEQRLVWQTVLGDLDKAENYTLTSQSQELRARAIENLDSLDAINRLDYKQAIVGGLDADVKVISMVATATDLYLLNAEQGNVLRAIMTGRGYEIDPNFQCGPTYGPIDVGPLVDIAELPPGAFENASLLGMDANGNLLYCVVGSQPYSATMAPPNAGFGEPTAMTLDRNDFYVLDPKVNAVWMFKNLTVSQQPRLFFGDEIPPMEDVIDLAVYNSDLYLLHADGHITKCIFSGLAESPTRCDDPYPYSDNRPGRIHGPVIEDTVFSHIYFLSFPDRSIYLLDPQNQALYYFSVLLNLQWQYQPKASVAEGKATAFAISPNRTAFLAIGNYVYYAAMP